MDKNRLLGESPPPGDSRGGGDSGISFITAPLRDCQGTSVRCLLSTAACPLLIFGEAFVHLSFTIPLELRRPPR